MALKLFKIQELGVNWYVDWTDGNSGLESFDALAWAVAA